MITFTMVGEVLQVVKIERTNSPHRARYLVYVASPKVKYKKEKFIMLPLYLTGTEEETEYLKDLLIPYHWYVFSGTIAIIHARHDSRVVTRTLFRIQSAIPLGVQRREEIKEEDLLPNPELIKAPSDLVGYIQMTYKKFNELQKIYEESENSD